MGFQELYRLNSVIPKKEFNAFLCSSVGRLMAAHTFFGFFEGLRYAADHQGHQTAVTAGKVGSFVVRQEAKSPADFPKHLDGNMAAESFVDFHAT